MHQLGSPLQNRLLEQVRAHLGGALAVGERVNEADLAERFGVSRTPVRHVLKHLEAVGLVAYERSRGFRVAQSFPTAEEGDEGDVANILDERMMRGIALGHLAGVVSERSLLQRYEVQRGELLSTLRRLMREGLVDPSPGRGWIFADISAESLKKSYAFRQIVEPAGILADSFRLDPQRLAELQAAHRAALDRLDSMKGRALFDLDARFHLFLAQCAQTGFLEQAIERQNNIRRLAEYIALVRIERIAQSMREHLDIMSALERGERQLAAALMRAHLRVSAEETFDHLDADLERVRAGQLALGDSLVGDGVQTAPREEPTT